nr:hypothetical protein [Tanacetum cinerariifolium]
RERSPERLSAPVFGPACAPECFCRCAPVLGTLPGRPQCSCGLLPSCPFGRRAALRPRQRLAGCCAESVAGARGRLVTMRLIFTKLLVCGWLVLAGTGTIQAQAGDQLSAVRSAIASGSSHDLAQYLSPSVEVGFDGDSQNMNATQTELVLKNFFAKNAAGKFDIVHQGAGPDGTPYAVGRYTGRNADFQRGRCHLASAGLARRRRSGAPRRPSLYGGGPRPQHSYGRAAGAQLHAAHEWHCYLHGPPHQPASRHQSPPARHPQNDTQLPPLRKMGGAHWWRR